jgi:hypothetical protein
MRRLRLTAVLLLLPLAVQLGGRSAAAGSDPVIEAAGDIGCSGTAWSATTCHQKATADILARTLPTLVLALGDNQYSKGALYDYNSYFSKTWGKLKWRMRPVPGNHEYATAGASGYFKYFGRLAGDPTKGYYSYDLGAWHIVALNSTIAHGWTSAQVQWLQLDLATHPRLCTLAYWHHPRWSSGEHGSNASVDPFWRLLAAYRAEVVLNGHDHDYERFARQTPDGMASADGIREFVVGTGGKSHYPIVAIQPNSRVRNTNTFGVLKLALHSTSYSWRFLPEAGKTFTDYGSNYCR